MRLTVFSSGSGGNCALVEAGPESGGARVLVDAGLPLKTVRQRAQAAGVRLAGVTDLLLTHEHADHGGCAGVFGRKLHVTVRATEGTLRALRDPPPEEQWEILAPGETLRLGGCQADGRPAPLPAAGHTALRLRGAGAAIANLGTPAARTAPALPGQGPLIDALLRSAGGSPLVVPVPLRPRSEAQEAFERAQQQYGLFVTAIALPHDAAAPVAYRFEERTPRGVASAAICTDLGHVPESVARALEGLDLLVLEFNHDVKMLLEGPYPWPLKQRIRGGRGHLSNEQAAALLERLCHPGLREVVLAHLSEHNNSPGLARAAAAAALSRAGCSARLQLGSVQDSVQTHEVEPGRAPLRRRPAQLALL
jgi:phosphoribosyl 1,2-cyclic phosphodiesterase